MKKYVFERDTSLKEMANLETKETGLDHGIIYVSSKEGNHGPRIKFYRGKAGEGRPSASISISKTPEVVEDSIGLKSQEIKELFQFVTLNKKRLLYLWSYGTSLTWSEWSNKIRSIKKIQN